MGTEILSLVLMIREQMLLTTESSLQPLNKYFFKTGLFLVYVYECFVCAYVCVLHDGLISAEVKTGCWSPGSGVIDSCEEPCGFCQLNLGFQ